MNRITAPLAQRVESECPYHGVVRLQYYSDLDGVFEGAKKEHHPTVYRCVFFLYDLARVMHARDWIGCCMQDSGDWLD